jgi:OFA family oxalate/formate antiporter-like MFS transporter
MAASVVPGPKAESCVVKGWLQICAGIVAMMAIVNLQYAWTLFTKSLTVSLNTTLAVIQLFFAAFILAETWLVLIEGHMIDGHGPRAMFVLRRSRIGSKGGKSHG